MKNRSLVRDYIERSKIRCQAISLFFDKESYADVVREAQEVVELVCKALVRHLGAEPARVHDVSSQLEALKHRLKDASLPELEKLIEASRELRRDRELAFYGSEDLTPSEFYSKKDAERALKMASRSVEFVDGIVGGQ